MYLQSFAQTHIQQNLRRPRGSHEPSQRTPRDLHKAPNDPERDLKGPLNKARGPQCHRKDHTTPFKIPNGASFGPKGPPRDLDGGSEPLTFSKQIPRRIRKGSAEPLKGLHIVAKGLANYQQGSAVSRNAQIHYHNKYRRSHATLKHYDNKCQIQYHDLDVFFILFLFKREVFKSVGVVRCPSRLSLATLELASMLWQNAR